MSTEAVDVNTPKKRRSVALTANEHKALKMYRKKFLTGVECAESIGIDRVVLDRVITIGSGAPETIEKIRLIISQDSGDGVA